MQLRQRDFVVGRIEPGDFGLIVPHAQALRVADMAGVSFLASIGIRLLVTSARAQAARGGTLVRAATNCCARPMTLSYS